MNWKGAFLLSLIVLGMGGCVAPFYGTARIEEGWHVDVGLAGSTYLKDRSNLDVDYDRIINPGDPYFYAIRSDIELRYGLNKYIQGSIRTGLGIGFHGYIYDAVPREVEDDFLFDMAIGPQFALPIDLENVGQITPAMRLEACYGYGQFYLLPTFVLGLGNPEYFTLGGRFYHPEVEMNFFPCEVFASIHLWRFDFFAGVNVYTTWWHPDYWRVPPVVTVGIGYKIK